VLITFEKLPRSIVRLKNQKERLRFNLTALFDWPFNDGYTANPPPKQAGFLQ
jgi:hypothetical protein